MTDFVSIYLVGFLVLQLDFICFSQYFWLKIFVKSSVNAEQYP